MARVPRKKPLISRMLANEMTWLALVILATVLFLFAPEVASISKSVMRTGDERMLFTGDIMLARHVERLMKAEGAYYPFKGVRDLLLEHTAVVGNFEASIPAVHVPTPSMTFRFSVDEQFIAPFPEVGFTDMTLANNHTNDHGKDGLLQTKEALAGVGISSAGDPLAVSPEDILYKTIDGVRIAIIPINATYRMPHMEDVGSVIAHARTQSDMQIVSIHWGEEYVLTANTAQTTFAHALIDQGIDAIIGHHPHVVQNIEVYRGAPIFYSLGNFIFDQYWMKDVQEGLTVSLSFKGNEVRYTLIPVTSADTRSAPRPMDRVERIAFLDALASRSNEPYKDAIREGQLTQLYEALGAL